MQENSNIIGLIDRKMAQLSPKMQVAAAFVAANPIEVSCRSMRYIAEMTELPPPTFSRLARELGFDDYEGLKESCRQSARDTYTGYRDRARDLKAIQSDPEQRDMFHATYGLQAMRNIDDTLLKAGGETLAEMADELLTARQVFVNAQMGVGHLGAYMVYVASLAFDDWHVLGQDTGSVAAQLRRLGETDIVLSLGCAPYARRTLDQLQMARDCGAKCFAITDSVTSPLFSMADKAIIAETSAPHFFASQISTLYLIETLLGLMVAKGQTSIQDNLHSSELFSDRIGEYIKGGNPKFQ